MRDEPAGWMVYRCSGPETGNLEDALGEMGLETWTPRTWVRKRLPRRKARETVLLALLPTYLFVRDGSDTRALKGLGLKLGFSGPMVIRGEVVVIPDPDLEGLRSFDDRVSKPQLWAASPSASGGSKTELCKGGEARSTTGGASENRIPQDAFRSLDVVKIVSGPFGALGIEATVEEVLDGGERIQISPFGGRIIVPQSHLILVRR